MTVRYKTYKGATQPYYLCQSKGIATATPICQNIPGALIDYAVGQLLLQTLTPLAVEVALSVQGELDSRAAEADQLRKTHVQRAAQRAEMARRRYLAVDPDNRLVADTLEADWNDALRQLAAAQDDYQRQHAAAAVAISDAQRAQVLALAGDFPALWNDLATPQRERKRMVRLLIDDVTLDKTDAIAIHVRLKGGQTTTLSTAIPPRAWEARQTPPEIIAEIDRLLEHHTDIEIAEILNQKGLRSGDRKPFHRLMIRNLRESYQLRSRYDRLRDAGMLTLSEIADHLGLSTATIKSYRLEGLLVAHAYNDKNECLYPIPDKKPNKQTGRPPKNGRPNKEPSEQP